MGETQHAIGVERTGASELMGLEETAKIDEEEEAAPIDLASIWLGYRRRRRK